jgi:hypothetical protein
MPAEEEEEPAWYAGHIPDMPVEEEEEPAWYAGDIPDMPAEVEEEPAWYAGDAPSSPKVENTAILDADPPKLTRATWVHCCS